jgi:adenylate cyclase class IV
MLLKYLESMKAHNLITIQTINSEQTNALLAFVKALKMKFEIKSIDTPYNTDFLAKIEKSRKDYKKGKGIVVSIDELKKLCK